MSAVTIGNDEFDLLESFLGLFGKEVQAHGREELSEADKERLRQLAAGQLAKEERSALVPLLASNESAMEFLVKEAG
ncbi:MAG: hypothetical protein ACSHYB_17835 [Roseibacillus sp.]